MLRKSYKFLILNFWGLFCLPCLGFSPIASLRLEEKVGQLLMVHFHGEEANEEAKTLIQQVQVGGIIYYPWANALSSPQQVRRLSLSLQKLARQNRTALPLLLAVDQEGGLVNRLTKGFTIFPGNKALGMTADPALSELAAFAIGQELCAVGINMNLAPVVDINSHPRNPVIGIRAFGECPEIVCAFARSALQGYHKAGILTSLKHFPGHGEVEVDSHEELPVVKKTLAQLKKMELLPFYQLAARADSIMTAHLLVPALDPKNCATLSPSILDLLRQEIGFEGVILSDSLIMEGLLKTCASVEEAAIRALNAGCDMLILGGKQLMAHHGPAELTTGDVQRIHSALVRAVQEGLISQERLDRAVQRVLDLKSRAAPPLPEEELGHFTLAHQALAKKIAALALRSTKHKTGRSFPLRQSKIALFAPQIVRSNLEQTSLLKIGSETHPLFFQRLPPTEEEIQAAQALAKEVDGIIFCSYNAWQYPAQAALVQALLNTGKPLILLCLRDPLDASLFPKADLILTTFSPTAAALQAACDQIAERVAKRIEE